MIRTKQLHKELREFDAFDASTVYEEQLFALGAVPVYLNEFWTSKQRAAHSLHEISYRACFKPQLPRFFIERLTRPGDVVYDPFMGRGTTLLEAALMGRRIAGCDINPMSRNLIEPRLTVPDLDSVQVRLGELDLSMAEAWPEDLLTFYHPETLAAIAALRGYFIEREATGQLDAVDRWLRMVATNRLTGHSAGFFSVYTMPPNQAVSVKSQKRINERRQQTPPLRDVKTILLKKTKSLLRQVTESERERLAQLAQSARYLTGSCDAAPDLEDASVQLVVTSPPFLDVVDYQQDNWLRGWFNGVDTNTVPIWQLKREADWMQAMQRVFVELERVLKPGGFVAFEVGEVRNGLVKMEELVLKAIYGTALEPQLILINAQDFTKTANCWGVTNQKKGTNTNRIILLQKR